MWLELTLAWLAIAPQGGESIPELQLGTPIENAIVDGDPVVHTPTLDANFTDAPVVARRYQLRVEKTGTYTIELRSYLFDAYLVLRDEKANVLFEDDDGLIGTHARITTKLAGATDYELQACALHRGRGAFEVRIVAGPPSSMTEIERSQAAIEDAKRTVEAREHGLGSEHPDTAVSLDDLAFLLRIHGDFAAARPLFERALAIREKTLGPEDPVTAMSLNNLAALLQAQGNLANARPLYERALAIWEKTSWRDRPDMAMGLGNLASLLQAQGDPAAARPLFERALAIREKALGPEHPATATSLNSLAELLQIQGDFAAARPLSERALAIREKTLESAHPDVAVSLNTLAFQLRAEGDLAAARPLFERALAIRERALGPEDPATASSLNNLATVLQAQGDSATAGQLYERALAIYEKTSGRDHPNTALTLNNLATLFQDQGDLVAARPLFERALAIREKTSGPEDPDTATSLNNLALLLQNQSEFVAARPLYERALAIMEKTVGPEHPDTATSLESLAALRAAQGDLGAARPLLARALAINEKTLGPEHPRTAASLNLLASLLVAQGDFAAARPLSERALANRERTLGPEHPETAKSLNNLASILRAQGDIAAARPLLERALAIQEKTVGSNHPDTAMSLNNLAVLLENQGDFATARPLLERALAINKKTLGPEHPVTATNLGNLACLLADMSDLRSAVELSRRAWSSHRGGELALLTSLTEAESFSYLASVRGEIETLLSFSEAVGDSIGAYEAALDWKGQLSRLLLASRARISSRLDSGQSERLRELRAAQADSSKLAFTHEVADRKAHEEQLAALREKKEHLERELQGSIQSLIPDAPSFGDLRGKLERGSALVDFLVHPLYEPARRDGDSPAKPGHWSEPRVSVWITRSESDVPVHLDLGPAAELETSVSAFLDELVSRRGGTAGQVVQRGQAPVNATGNAEIRSQLRRRLWNPIAARLDGVQRVFVSPDGFLGTLPFETLELDDKSFLIEHFDFVYLQSAPSLAQPRCASWSFGELLCVGGIDYDERAAIETSSGDRDVGAIAVAANSSGSRSDLRSGMANSWVRLQQTELESQVVSALHEASFPNGQHELLLGRDATEERLKRDLPRCSVVHLATHGFFNPEGIPSLWEAALKEAGKDGPQFSQEEKHLFGKAPGLLSGIVCAGANAEPEEGRDDGYLTAEEVGWLDLSKVELVVLSACETGLGRAQSGEGLLGLRRAFEIAGAKTVISSLWSVQDESTSKLMQSFYSNLWVKKMGRADALRAAQLEMLAKNRAEFHDALPSTWGAFVLSGEWR